MRNILGEIFGKFTVIKDDGDKNNKKKQYMIEVQCSCGSIRTYPKSTFFSGRNPEKCDKCHRKLMKSHRTCW